MKNSWKLLLIFISKGILHAGEQKIHEYGDEYLFKYSFQDHQNALQEFEWQYNKWKLNNYIYDFGLSAQEGEGVRVDKNELQKSNMYLNGGDLYFKYDKIVIDSRSIVRPLYVEFKRYIRAKKLNRREQIELIMRFLQDIPYYIPPKNYRERFIGGLFPPSELLKNGKGDCDSKSVLMASILAHDLFYYDKMAMILVPGHALLAIEAPPMAYDQSIDHGGRTFVYAEPVGPRRTPFGRTNSPYSTGIEVFPLKLFPPEGGSDFSTASSATSSGSSTTGSSSSTGGLSDCPDGGLLIEYERPFAPEIVKSCQVKIDGNYVKHGPTQVVSKDTGKVISTEHYKKGAKF